MTSWTSFVCAAIAGVSFLLPPLRAMETQSAFASPFLVLFKATIQRRPPEFAIDRPINRERAVLSNGPFPIGKTDKVARSSFCGVLRTHNNMDFSDILRPVPVIPGRPKMRLFFCRRSQRIGVPKLVNIPLYKPAEQDDPKTP